MCSELKREAWHCAGLCAGILLCFALLVAYAGPDVSRPAPKPEPSTNIVRLVWDQPGTCHGWLIEQSHDLRTWQRVTNLPAPPGHDFVNVTSPPIATTAPAFFRVAATP